MLKFRKFLSIFLICIIVIGQFHFANAALFNSDEEAAKSNPYIYSYNDANIADYDSKQMITDNELLVKSVYYSYGGIGYSLHFNDFEAYYLKNACVNETDKLQYISGILTKIYNQTIDTDTQAFLDMISSYEEEYLFNFKAYYIFNQDNQLIGFTYEVDKPVQMLGDPVEATTENTSADTSEDISHETGDDSSEEKQEKQNQVRNKSISDTEEALLQTSNGIYYNGHPDMASFTEINPKDYGLPYTTISDTWISASTDNQIEIAKVKFTYTEIGNSQNLGAIFGGATASITGSVSGSYSSDALVGKSVSLYHCMTGNTDSAPYYNNDSDEDSHLYIANNPDNICYMHFYVRSVDTTNHKVYVEIRTDYIDADYDRSNTSVQSIAGGIWYTYYPESFFTIQKNGITKYIDTDIIDQDTNLKAFTFENIKYGIYELTDKKNPIATCLLNAKGRPKTKTIQLESNKDYYIHELKGNLYYNCDDGFYKFNSGEYPNNTIAEAQNYIVYDSVNPYYIYFKKEDITNTNSNPLYTLAGAEYEVRDSKKNYAHFIVGYEHNNSNSYDKPIVRSNKTKPFITDKNGNLTFTFTYKGDSDNIKKYYKNVTQNNNTYTITFTKNSPLQVFYGTYYFSELSAPNGYTIDPSCNAATKHAHEIKLNSKNTQTPAICKCGESTYLTTLDLHIKKLDSETQNEKGLGSATLENAIFEICYYSNYYKTSNINNKTPQKKWYFATDKSGHINFQTNNPINTDLYKSDTFYYDSNKKRGIPLGTITIQEVAAPEGYLKISDSTSKQITINDFEVTNKDLILYQVKINDTNSKMDLYYEGTKKISSNTVNNSFCDDVKRGDLSFIKKDYKTDQPLSNIAFVLTSKTTGEQHIIVTDDNGFATTKAGVTQIINGKKVVHSHLNQTNGNDQYINNYANPNIYKNKVQPTGIWFYGQKNPVKADNTTINDKKGALPYDKYSIMEIISYKNQTKQMILDDDFTFNVERDGQTLYYSFSNMPNPVFSTNTFDNRLQNHVSMPDKDTTIIDTISYQYMRYNSDFTFKGILVAKEDCVTKDGDSYKAGEPIRDANGNYIRSNVSFHTQSNPNSSSNANASGEVQLTYNFDSTNLRGITGVWFTYLCNGKDSDLLIVKENGTIDKEASRVLSFYVLENELQYIEDESLSNPDEQISFTSIETDAWTSEYEINIDKGSPNTVITDTLHLSNLVENDAYTIVSTIVDGESGETITGTNGKPCILTTSNVLYKENPETKEMNIDIQLPEFDSSNYLGKHVVIYQEILQNDMTYAKEKDIDNTRETVYFPYIVETKATSVNGLKTIPISNSIVIQDAIQYDGMSPNYQYEMRGSLHYIDQKGKEQILCDKNNEPITNTCIFTPEQTFGELEMNFTFQEDDLSIELPESLIVYQELFYNDKLIYQHGDPSNLDQTVYFPTLSSTLYEKNSQSQYLSSYHQEIQLIDRVTYHNLSTETTYTMIGKLINSKTGKPLCMDKKEVLGYTTFKPEAADGSVDVAFYLDGTQIKDLYDPETGNPYAQLVAYEYLYSEFVPDTAEQINTDSNYITMYKDVELWSKHTNLEDANQTVTYVYGNTSFVNSNGEMKHFSKEGTIQLEDSITYHNLIVGREYTVTGSLYTSDIYDNTKAERDSNQKECNPILLKTDVPIQTTITFIPNQTNGTVKIPFSFEASDVQHIELIDSITAFEEIRDNTTNEVVFTHKEIDDLNQKVTFVELHTKAIDKKSKSSKALPDKKVTIIDTVSYSNLIPGKEYTIKGILYEKESGKPLVINKQNITNEITFTARKQNGEIPISFSFDGSKLENKKIVVFENLYMHQVLVASHADLNDRDQTIRMKDTPKQVKPPAATPDDDITQKTTGKKTGDTFPYFLISILCLIAGIVSTIIHYLNLKRRKISKKNE